MKWLLASDEHSVDAACAAFGEDDAIGREAISKLLALVAR